MIPTLNSCPRADDFDDVVDGNDSEMASQNTSDQEDDAMPIPIVRGGNGADSRNEDANRRSNGQFRSWLDEGILVLSWKKRTHIG